MKIDEKTLTILSTVKIDGNVIFLTCGQLDRKQYIAVNKVLEAMGGKWNRKIKGHIFSENPTEKLEQVLLYGEIKTHKEYGFFPTPAKIAKKIIEFADIKSGMFVLEPSAGQGGIADFVPKNCHLDCIELLPENVIILKKKGYKVQQGDFLSFKPNPIYHRIVMNPPFEKQQDIAHVKHAWKFLRKGGKLVSIMSAGIIFRENKKTLEFREMVNSYGYIEKLPEDSFKESGTKVNTCIVILEKLFK
ncbi:MAG: N-6 DNA methylase [Candidatus Heimdallarchaeaceae archaeon]